MAAPRRVSPPHWFFAAAFYLLASPQLARADDRTARHWTDRAYLSDTSNILIHAGAGNQSTEIGISTRWYGVELGLSAEESHARVAAPESGDRDPGGRGPAVEGTAWFVGVSPFTYGSWFHREDEFLPFAYSQPFVRYKRSRADYDGETRADSSWVVGNRAFFADAAFRIGFEAQIEVGGHSRSNDVSAFVIFGSGNKPTEGDDWSEGIADTLAGFAGIVVLGLVMAGASYIGGGQGGT